MDSKTEYAIREAERVRFDEQRRLEREEERNRIRDEKYQAKQRRKKAIKAFDEHALNKAQEDFDTKKYILPIFLVGSPLLFILFHFILPAQTGEEASPWYWDVFVALGIGVGIGFIFSSLVSRNLLWKQYLEEKGWKHFRLWYLSIAGGVIFALLDVFSGHEFSFSMLVKSLMVGGFLGSIPALWWFFRATKYIARLRAERDM